MAVLVGNCPRCGSQQMTFDALADIRAGVRHDWQQWFELFCECRNCKKSTVFIISQVHYAESGYWAETIPSEVDVSLNKSFSIEGYVSQKDMGAAEPPEHVPEGGVVNAFREGASSLAVGNWNAAGAMFRLVIDLATQPMLPEEDVEGLNRRTRRDLGLRLPWLFRNGKLPNDLRELSSCIREDGNDGAHAGTLTEEDARDLLDFTTVLLERIFTEPGRLRLAQERRDKRRKSAKSGNGQAEAASGSSETS